MAESTNEYLWAPGEEHPIIGDHSLAKHEVLGRYLRTYVDVLTTNLAMDRFPLTLVDGFAGGGIYRTTGGTLHHGSPLQMVHAMKEAEVTAKSRRTKEFQLDVEFYFIERKRQNREVLEATIEHDSVASSYRRSNRLHVLLGQFEQRAGEIVDRICLKGRTPRVIFLLDQYGYSKVPLFTLRNILNKLPNAEVLLTFATDWLIDYMSDEGVVSSRRLEEMGLMGMAEQFKTLVSYKEHRDPRWRRLVQSMLHQDLVQQSGAKYFTPFFIVSPRAHREYWFVHLSRHSRARDEMTRLHWDLQNRFAHYGRNGLGMLGYDPREDVLLTGQETFDFSNASSDLLLTRLAGEVPRKLHGGPDEGLAFSDFFDCICNETPATKEQIGNVLQRLSVEKEIEVRDGNTGKVRGAGVRIKSTDRIKLSSQLCLPMKMV